MKKVIIGYMINDPIFLLQKRKIKKEKHHESADEHKTTSGTFNE